MKCIECGGDTKKIIGDIITNDKFIGDYKVENVEYEECQKCGEEYYPANTLKILEEARKQKLEKLLKSLPLADYITAFKPAEILKISKQALHKNKQIKSKVYYIKVGDQKLFNKKSIELFKEKKDGRFILNKDKDYKKVSTGEYIEKYQNLEEFATY